MNQNKAAGAYYEACFRSTAMSHGLHIYDPVGDYLPVDAIVQNKAGKLFRIQIRGTAYKDKGCVKVSTRAGIRKTAYLSSSTYDVFAAYASDFGVWYLIPSTLMGNRDNAKFYPHVENSKGQWEKYKDRWSIFDASWS
ncbi:MAG: group I intron-associated PD-(D/E)XK endonuclease [Opitutae bacterium]